MVQSWLLRVLLFPFSLLYGLGSYLYQLAWDRGLLKSVQFDLPIIAVGNLSVGGSGKTPHVEYLIRLLHPYLQVGILSRGYKRQTRGFRIVSARDNARTVGDESLQYKRKFPQVVVAVAEERALAIPQLLKSHPELQVILLDDAYQHRAVKPGLNILLTEYNRPWTRDWLLPVGRLREWPCASQRADIVIATKCPASLSPSDASFFEKELKLSPHQQLFFSTYRYGSPYYLFNPQQRISLQPHLHVVLLSAIANTDYLLQYLEAQVQSAITFTFADHHYFSNYDMGQLDRLFRVRTPKPHLIITTEKDAVRLELHRQFILEKQLPIFVLPVEVSFLFDQGAHFDARIKQFLLDFKV